LLFVVVVVLVFSGDLKLTLEYLVPVADAIFIGIVEISVLDGIVAVIGLKEVVLFTCCW